MGRSEKKHDDKYTASHNSVCTKLNACRWTIMWVIWMTDFHAVMSDKP